MFGDITKQLKSILPNEIWDGVTTIVICVGGIIVLKKVVGGAVTFVNQKRMLSRWSNTPKDVVIVHRFQSAKTCPNASPFVLKLETFLRMAKIPYEVDETNPMSIKGKSPWISLNNEHVADSQLCIEFLEKKFAKKIGNYSKEQLAVATMARITLDEHFYWGLVIWRYVYTKGADCHKFFDFNPKLLKLFLWSFRGYVAQGAWAQGTLRHSKTDVIKMMCDDLRAVSAVLGDKKFILGDDPCTDDAAIFGELAEIVWCCPDSPYEALINDELRNLKEYCMRMKSTFWPDWDDWCSAGRKRLKDKKNN